MSVVKAYLRSGVTAVVSKVLGVVTGFTDLFFLNRILGKEDFGVFFIALTIVITLGLIVGSPFSRLVLYHGSRAAEGDATEERRYAAMLGWTVLLGLFATIALCLLARPAADVFNKSGVALVLVLLAPTVAIDAMRWTIAARLQAHQQIVRMTIVSETSVYAARLIGLPLVWICGGGIAGVGMVYVVSSIVAVGMGLWYAPVKPTLERHFTRWDVHYASRMFLTKTVTQNARTIDVLVVGALATAGAVADYALASRFASFLLTGKQLYQELLAARIGALLAADRKRDLDTEYHLGRLGGLVVAICGILAFMVIGPWMIPLFGDHATTYSLFLILSAVMLVHVGTGNSGEYIYMSGMGGWTMVTNGLMLGVSWLGALLLVPVMGIGGAAVAALLGPLTAEVVAYVLLRRTRDFRTVDGLSALGMAITGCGMIAGAYGFISMSAAAVTGFVSVLVCIYAIVRVYKTGLAPRP